MSVIENFAALSEKEQRDFAEALVKTINSEKTFTDDIEFKVDSVEAYDMTGELLIELSHDNYFYVDRAATWACGNEEDAAYEKPEHPEYESNIFRDIEKAFKTLSTEIDGYTLTLDVADTDEEEIEEVKVDRVSPEDGGIGHYEYFGYDGYDSQPYNEVTGILTQSCKVYLGLTVEPTVPAPEKEIEEN